MNRFAGKLTRRLALLAAGAAFTALPLLAQQDAPPPPPDSTQTQGPPPGGPHGPGGRGGMNPQHRLEMMKQQLGLTDDQALKIKGIMDESRGKMEEVRANTSLSPEDMHGKTREIMKHENEKIRDVLTPDQQAKYDAMMPRRHGPRGPEGPGGPGDTPPPPPSSPQTPQ